MIQNTLNVEQSRRLLKALADPIRLDVIHALAQGERCVCELTGELNLSQSKLSFHLRVLREAGLVMDRQNGRWIYYRCLLYTSPSPRDATLSRMPSSA